MLDIILLKNRRKDKTKPLNIQQSVLIIYIYLTLRIHFSSTAPQLKENQDEKNPEHTFRKSCKN